MQAYNQGVNQVIEEYYENAKPALIASLRKNLEELVEQGKAGTKLWNWNLLDEDKCLYYGPRLDYFGPRYYLSRNGTLKRQDILKKLFYFKRKLKVIAPEDIPFETFDASSVLYAVDLIERLHTKVFEWKKS